MKERSCFYVYVAFICEPMLLVSATRTVQPSVRPSSHPGLKLRTHEMKTPDQPKAEKGFHECGL